MHSTSSAVRVYERAVCECASSGYDIPGMRYQVPVYRTMTCVYQLEAGLENALCLFYVHRTKSIFIRLEERPHMLHTNRRVVNLEHNDERVHLMARRYEYCCCCVGHLRVSTRTDKVYHPTAVCGLLSCLTFPQECEPSDAKTTHPQRRVSPQQSRHQKMARGSSPHAPDGSYRKHVCCYELLVPLPLTFSISIY